MTLETRIKIEQQITGATIRALLGAGFSLGVFDGEEHTLEFCKTPALVAKALMTTDEDHLTVFDNEKNFIGSVFFVYGNDGWDVICDYSTSLEEYLEPVNALADRLAEKHG